MDNDNVLDLRHLIRLADDDNQELNENWKDYSSSSSEIALKEDAKEYFLDGKAKRRLRRAQERKLNKHKKKTL